MARTAAVSGGGSPDASTPLDILPMAVWIVDSRDRVLRMNEVAARLSAGPPLAVRGEHICRERSASTVLNAIARARHGKQLSLREGDCVVQVAAVPPDPDDLFHHLAGVVVVRASGVPIESLARRIVIRHHFGATEREAMVADLILAGRSVPEITAHLGRTRETVRTHLKHLFAKTGTNRQADLARVLRSQLLPDYPPDRTR